MPDVFSKEKRSEIMSANRGKGNKSTEMKLFRLLEEAGVTGWRSNATDVKGKPDFVFDEYKLAIFVDGCFWHGCPECRRIPASNHEFWEAKIRRTKERDLENNTILTELGWKVVRIWEHELRKQSKECLEKILQQIHQIESD